MHIIRCPSCAQVDCGPVVIRSSERVSSGPLPPGFQNKVSWRVGHRILPTRCFLGEWFRRGFGFEEWETERFVDAGETPSVVVARNRMEVNEHFGQFMRALV